MYRKPVVNKTVFLNWQEAKRRRQEVSQGIRDGEQRYVVHSLPLEEGMPEVHWLKQGKVEDAEWCTAGILLLQLGCVTFPARSSAGFSRRLVYWNRVILPKRDFSKAYMQQYRENWTVQPAEKFWIRSSYTHFSLKGKKSLFNLEDFASGELIFFTLYHLYYKLWDHKKYIYQMLFLFLKWFFKMHTQGFYTLIYKCISYSFLKSCFFQEW